MAQLPRLNGAIGALERGDIALTAFSPPDIRSAQTVASAPYDAVIFEMEHNPFDPQVLRDCLQYMLDPRRIAQAGSVAPAVTPMVRLPCNGAEMSQWMAKQALDMGVYGIVWPHVRTVAEAHAAVAACRYARPDGDPLGQPRGRRGDGPGIAVRYWGLTQQEYYARADVWPINPNGEILVGMMCESVEAIENLPAILREVPGMSLVIIGEGDLSQNLGVPRQYDHPLVVEHMRRIVDICNEYGAFCGHPHVGVGNIDTVLGQGYRWLIASPAVSFGALERGRAALEKG